MKYFLLMAGDRYYPQGGTEDWKETYETRKEAEEAVHHFKREINTIYMGQHTEEFYLIDDVKYDWYKIIDLREWM